MVLQTLDALGPLHGYGIARRIEQISDDALTLKEGTVYASLVRLQQDGCIRSRWAPSDNNRKAKFYEITRRGKSQLAVETRNWKRVAGAIQRLLKLAVS
jgi:PadR family transcriptional regulator